MATQAFAWFDKDNDGRLHLREMKESVCSIFVQRKFMAQSLKDTDSIVGSLEFGIGCVAHFVMGALYLLVWGVDILKGFSTFSATVLALTFVFGNSVRQVYEAMLFLFVEHAYDVGDLLDVEGALYTVKQIRLMCTCLVRTTGERSYYPNARLIALPVINLTRSEKRCETCKFFVDAGAGAEAARAAVGAALQQHYSLKSADFADVPTANFSWMADPFKAQLAVSWQYSFPGDDLGRMSRARASLLASVQAALHAVHEAGGFRVAGDGSWASAARCAAAAVAPYYEASGAALPPHLQLLLEQQQQSQQGASRGGGGGVGVGSAGGGGGGGGSGQPPAPIDLTAWSYTIIREPPRKHRGGRRGRDSGGDDGADDDDFGAQGGGAGGSGNGGRGSDGDGGGGQGSQQQELATVAMATAGAMAQQDAVLRMIQGGGGGAGAVPPGMEALALGRGG
jgi:hypothetical protein